MPKAHCMVVARDPTTGAVLTSATVNVYTPGTVTPIPATIFDRNNNTLSNPLTADATTGLVDFYLNVAQEVDLVVSKSAYTTRTYSNVPVLDDASNDLTALLTTTGDIAYASSANTPARLGIGATNDLLQVVGGIPAWSTNPANLAGGTSFTPTVSQSAAVSTSVANGFYIQIGKLVFFTCNITCSSAGTASNAIAVAGLPVNSQQRGVACVGVSTISSNTYRLIGIWNGATTMLFWSADGGASNFGGSQTLANGSTITLTGVYEAS